MCIVVLKATEVVFTTGPRTADAAARRAVSSAPGAKFWPQPTGSRTAQERSRHTGNAPGAVLSRFPAPANRPTNRPTNRPGRARSNAGASTPRSRKAQNRRPALGRTPLEGPHGSVSLTTVLLCRFEDLSALERPKVRNCAPAVDWEEVPMRNVRRGPSGLRTFRMDDGLLSS